MKKRYSILKHLDSQLPRPGDTKKARDDALRIAEYLKNEYHAVVYGVGSLFLSGREFTEESDIDLVVKGLPPRRFFSILNDVNEMSRFTIELVPWEDANEYLREQAEKEGEIL
jgi:predicted nucleotidyltransferase